MNTEHCMNVSTESFRKTISFFRDNIVLYKLVHEKGPKMLGLYLARPEITITLFSVAAFDSRVGNNETISS